VFDSFPAAQDIITDGRNGFLIKPFSIRKYAEVLRQLMTDEDLLEQVAIDAFSDSKRFEVQLIANQWEAVFDELLPQKEVITNGEKKLYLHAS
jgi:glycosyltransferase involved in cell wall biosynthesis